MSGMASLAFAIWLDRAKRSSVPSKVFWAVGFLLIFVSFYRAWINEHIARLKAENDPSLVGEIAGFAGFGPGELDREPVISILLKIRNLGTPSFASGYAASFALDGKSRTLDLIVTDPPEKATVAWKRRGHAAPGMDLPLSFHTAAIARGEMLIGYVLARLGDLTPGEIERGVVTVQFHDVLGRKHSASASSGTLPKLSTDPAAR